MNDAAIDIGEMRRIINTRLAVVGTRVQAGDAITACPSDIFLTKACPEGTVNLGEARDLVVFQIQKQVNLILVSGKSRQLEILVKYVGRKEPR